MWLGQAVLAFMITDNCCSPFMISMENSLFFYSSCHSYFKNNGKLAAKCKTCAKEINEHNASL